jgi:hypothetical protein
LPSGAGFVAGFLPWQSKSAKRRDEKAESQGCEDFRLTRLGFGAILIVSLLLRCIIAVRAQESRGQREKDEQRKKGDRKTSKARTAKPKSPSVPSIEDA